MGAFEEAGLPSVAVLSDAFLPQIDYMYTARQLGLEAVGTAIVPHPISDQTSSQMRAKADGVVEAVMVAL